MISTVVTCPRNIDASVSSRDFRSIASCASTTARVALRTIPVNRDSIAVARTPSIASK
jgi:hypothetical protein